jgi:hypothetical protein
MYSHAVEHRIATGEHSHSLFSAILREDLLNGWGHRRRPRDTGCRRTGSWYEGKVASTSVDQLSGLDRSFGLIVQSIPAIFADAYDQQPMLSGGGGGEEERRGSHAP